MDEDQVKLMAHGPKGDETKRLAFKQMTSAFHFAYTAWEFVALGRQLQAIGALANNALANIAEACRLLNCNEFVLTDKMQDLSGWLEERGIPGIRSLVRTEDGHILVVKKTAGELVDQMKQYRDAAMELAEALSNAEQLANMRR